MLVLARHIGESILIGEEIIVTVKDVEGGNTSALRGKATLEIVYPWDTSETATITENIKFSIKYEDEGDVSNKNIISTKIVRLTVIASIFINEMVYIGKNIMVVVTEVGGAIMRGDKEQVRLGIIAPKEYKIHRPKTN